jgi:hypothetical protein
MGVPVDIGSSRREKLDFLAVDVEKSSCVVKGSSSTRL